MIFADIPIADAEGVILAHTTKGDGWVLKKGKRLTQEDCALLQKGSVATVMAAKLETGDVHEDDAARRVASDISADHVTPTTAFTGRCNIAADTAGVVRINADAIHRLNCIDESVTVATLPDYARAEKGQIIATVKIIPFAVESAVMSEVVQALRELERSIYLVPFKALRVVLINTTLPTLKDSVRSKTTELTRRRVASVGGAVEKVLDCAHDASSVSDTIALAINNHDPDLITVVGASVTVDRADAVPSGIEKAGGRIIHFGMPVDPGNMMLLARHNDVPVVVLPGCARSPKLNGIDWILERFAAGLDVNAEDVMRLGVGGLLVDSPVRPLPRDEAVRSAAEADKKPRIAAIILAAGQSRRMGAINKLLEPIEGIPLVQRTVESVAVSGVDHVVVVTGYEAEAIETALSGAKVTLVHNPKFADGLSTSLKAGLEALSPDTVGAIVCLADMPAIQPNHIDALIEPFDPEEGHSIGVPVFKGKRGNPVLWARRFFNAMTEVSGDVGARHLIGDYADLVYEVEFGDTAVLTDLDTPEQLARYRDGSTK